MAYPRRNDWGIIEVEWRRGILNANQISKKYDISRAALLKHFEQRDVKRADLEPEIQKRAAAIVAEREAEVQTEGAKLRAEAEQDRAEAAKVREKEVKTRESEIRECAAELLAEKGAEAVVESNAQYIAAALIEERSDVKRARAVSRELLCLLEASVAEKRQQQIETETAPKGLAPVIKDCKDMFEALRTSIELERKVLRIKDDMTLEDLLNQQADKISAGVSSAMTEEAMATLNKIRERMMESSEGESLESVH